ncbi:MAG: hypothetical protein AB7K64_10465 [Variibacter sp.]
MARELGSLAASLSGADALVFTGGIGENASEVRTGVCRLSEWLGIVLDEEANARNALRISSPASKVLVYVLPTDENVVIAKHTQRVLGARHG